MTSTILASPKRLAVISDTKLDPADWKEGLEVKYGGTSEKLAWKRKPAGAVRIVQFKPPKGWDPKPGETFEARFRDEAWHEARVVEDAELDPAISGPSRPGGATTNGDRNGNGDGRVSRHGSGDGGLDGVLSFPLPVRSADSVSSSGPLDARAKRLLQLTLGPISDYASADVLRRALGRRTETVEEGGIEKVRWRTGLGGIADVETEVTGEQAGELSLAIQVKDIAGEIVETLHPVFPNRNPSEIETTREVLRALLDEVVEELSRPEISTAVIGTLADSLRAALAEFGLALAYADENGRIEDDDVIVGAEETELTRFRILQRWIRLEADALDELAGETPQSEFGTGIYRLEQFLDGAGAAAGYLRTVLDQYVDFTALERRNHIIDLDGRSISLEALLDRVENRIAVVFRAQVGVAGRTAVRAGIPSLALAADAARQLRDAGADSPEALRNPIVRQGVLELEEQLSDALATAQAVATPPPYDAAADDHATAH